MDIQVSGCRVCIEIGHSKPQCKVVDLYNVPQSQRYFNPFEARFNQAKISQPLVDYYYNQRQGRARDNFDLNTDYKDENDLEDDSDDA